MQLFDAGVDFWDSFGILKESDSGNVMRNEGVEFLAQELPIISVGDKIAAQVLAFWDIPFRDIGPQQEIASARTDTNPDTTSPLMKAYKAVSYALSEYESAKQMIVEAKKCRSSQGALDGFVRTVTGAIERVEISAIVLAEIAMSTFPKDAFLCEEALSLLERLETPARGQVGKASLGNERLELVG